MGHPVEPIRTLQPLPSPLKRLGAARPWPIDSIFPYWIEALLPGANGMDQNCPPGPAVQSFPSEP